MIKFDKQQEELANYANFLDEIAKQGHAPVFIIAVDPKLLLPGSKVVVGATPTAFTQRLAGEDIEFIKEFLYATVKSMRQETYASTFVGEMPGNPFGPKDN